MIYDSSNISKLPIPSVYPADFKSICVKRCVQHDTLSEPVSWHHETLNLDARPATKPICHQLLPFLHLSSSTHRENDCNRALTKIYSIRRFISFKKRNNSTVLNFIPFSSSSPASLRRKSSKSRREEYQCVYRRRFYEVASIIGYSTWSGDGGGRTRIIVSRAIACISSWFRLELEFVIRDAANQRSVADFMEIRSVFLS